MTYYHYGPRFEYEYIEGKQKQVQKGYEVTERFQFRDALDKGPSLCEGLAPYASLDSTHFAVSRYKEFDEHAVDLAIANADEKARRRAEKLKVVIGRVLHFEEGMVHVPSHRGQERYAMSAMADSEAAPELPAGEAEIQAFVTVVYEIM